MFRHHLMACCSAAALLCPAVAGAQVATGTTATASDPASPQAPTSANGPSDPGLADIVVTAQKREEPLQKTPAAIQVIGAAQLVDRGVTDLIRITNQVTGITVAPSRQGTVVFSRGLGQSDTQSQTPVAVEVQLDGLTLPKDAQTIAFFDIANIQALKGPQGILYGRNAVGGALLVTSRRPSFDRFEADGVFEVGNYDTRHATVAASIPAGADVAFRGAVDYFKHDGYETNGGYAADTISGRLSMAAKPTDRLSIFLAGTYSHRKGNGYSIHVRPYDPAANENPFYVSPVPTTGTVGFANFDDPHNRGFDTSKAYLINGQVDYALTDQLKLTYVGGYFHYDSAQVDASAIKPLGIFQSNQLYYFIENTRDIQNETRLSFTEGKLHVIVGALQHRFETPITSLALAYPSGPIVNGPYDYTEHNYAIFGNVELPVSDRLRLEGGLRQSWDRKEVIGTLSGTPVDLNRSNFPQWKHLSWKVGVQFDAAPRILVYANIQNGYLPGSYQSASVATLTALGRSRRYGEETVTAYTAGVKSRFADSRVQLNVEGFYYDYGGFQVNQRLELIVLGQSSFQNAYANIKKSRIYGADIDLTAKPIRNGTLTFGVSLLNAKIVNTGFTSLAVLQSNGSFLSIANPDLHGFQLPNSPNATVNLGYEQIFPLGNGGNVTANAATHYEGKRWLDFTHPNVALAHQDAYTKTDVSLTYHSPGNRWSLGVWGRNLENKATYSGWGGFQLRNAGVVVNSYSTSYVDAPRTYGARAGFNF